MPKDRFQVCPLDWLRIICADSHVSFLLSIDICHLKKLSSKKRKGKKSDRLLYCPVGVLSIEYSPYTYGASCLEG